MAFSITLNEVVQDHTSCLVVVWFFLLYTELKQFKALLDLKQLFLELELRGLRVPEPIRPGEAVIRMFQIDGPPRPV